MSAVFTPPRVKLTVDRFEKMGEAGIFGGGERIELIEGELVEMAPIGGPHFGVVNALTDILVRAVGSEGTVSVQNPIGLLPDSEPQPDVVILKPGFQGRRARIPRAADVLLVIEVADTTLRYDTDVKLPIYARAGLPEAWVVDVSGLSIEVYRAPTPQGYTSHRSARDHDAIALLQLPRIVVRVADVLG